MLQFVKVNSYELLFIQTSTYIDSGEIQQVLSQRFCLQTDL